VKILLATSNEGKLRDLRAIAAGAPDVLLDLVPRAILEPAPKEAGDTFEANAVLKAVEFSLRAPSALLMADDSGLEVDALAGAPGVHSARYAVLGHELGNAADKANNAKLLCELAEIPDALRTARFVCVLALAIDGRVTHIARGEVEGVILREPRGSAGFGYDPLFFVPELGVTFAEISPEQKGAYSHRGRAFQNLLQQLFATS
jgi:XTP/dITP diphosphohydrolase